MENIVEKLVLAIGMDLSDVDKGINKTIDKVKTGFTDLLTNAVAPAIAGIATGSLVQEFTEEVTQLDRLSKALGMNIEQLNAWQGAAEMAGVEGDEIAEIFADLNDWMVDAHENQSGAMYDFIQKGMLPAVEDAQGNLKTTEQYALDLADALNALGEQEGSGIARQIGLSNLNNAAFLQQGSAAIKEQIAVAREMGTVTSADAEAARELNKAMGSIQRSIKMLLMPVVRSIVNPLSIFAEAVLRLTRNLDKMKPIIVVLAGVLTGVLVPAFKKSIVAAMKFFATPPGMLVAALGMILLILDDFLTWIEGGESAFGKFYEKLFGDTTHAKELLENLGKFIERFGGYAKVFLVVAGAVTLLNLALGVATTLMTVLSTVAGVVLSPIGMAVLAIGAAVLLVNHYWDNLVAAFDSGMEWIISKIDLVKSTWNDLVAIFKDGIKWFSEKIDKMADKMSNIKGMLPSLDFKVGAAEAVPGSAVAGAGAITNHETNIDGKVNITINGNADAAAIKEAKKSSSDYYSGFANQADSSQ